MASYPYSDFFKLMPLLDCLIEVCLLRGIKLDVLEACNRMVKQGHTISEEEFWNLIRKYECS